MRDLDAPTSGQADTAARCGAILDDTEIGVCVREIPPEADGRAVDDRFGDMLDGAPA